jgi:hypothetical protein
MQRSRIGVTFPYKIVPVSRIGPGMGGGPIGAFPSAPRSRTGTDFSLSVAQRLGNRAPFRDTGHADEPWLPLCVIIGHYFTANGCRDPGTTSRKEVSDCLHQPEAEGVGGTLRAVYSTD